MFVSRREYNTLVEKFPTVFQAVWQCLERHWSLSGIRVSGSDRMISRLGYLVSLVK